MSALEKYGAPGELNRIMADDICQGCGSMLLSTADGKVCLTCQGARSGNEQGEPAWDELRKQATCGPPVETMVEPLPLPSVEEDSTAEPVPVLRQKQIIQPAMRAGAQAEAQAEAMIRTPEEPVAAFKTSLGGALPRAQVGALSVELRRVVSQLAPLLHSQVPKLGEQLESVSLRLEQVAGEMWQED